MADPQDLKGAHAREFTNHELLTLRIWFDLDQAGNDDLAERLLDAGLMLEHYTSLLDNDPSRRAANEVMAQSQLQFAFLQVLNEANTFLSRRARMQADKVPAMIAQVGLNYVAPDSLP